MVARPAEPQRAETCSVLFAAVPASQETGHRASGGTAARTAARKIPQPPVPFNPFNRLVVGGGDCEWPPNHKTIQRSNDPTVQRSNGPTDQRSNGLTNKRSNGPTVKRSASPSVSQAEIPVSQPVFGHRHARQTPKAHGKMTHRRKSAREGDRLDLLVGFREKRLDPLDFGAFDGVSTCPSVVDRQSQRV